MVLMSVVGVSCLITHHKSVSMQQHCSLYKVSLSLDYLVCIEAQAVLPLSQLSLLFVASFRTSPCMRPLSKCILFYFDPPRNLSSLVIP